MQPSYLHLPTNAEKRLAAERYAAGAERRYWKRAALRILLIILAGCLLGEALWQADRADRLPRPVSTALHEIIR